MCYGSRSFSGGWDGLEERDRQTRVGMDSKDPIAYIVFLYHPPPSPPLPLSSPYSFPRTHLFSSSPKRRQFFFLHLAFRE